MIATTQASAHDALEDPLSGSTRSSKRFMLVLSCIAILIVLTGVIPAEVSVFGLKFPGLTLGILNAGLIILLLISIVSFCVYGISDFFRFRHKLDVYNRCLAGDVNDAISIDSNSYEVQSQQHYAREFEDMTGYKPFEIPHRPTKLLISIRCFIDLFAPLIFSVFAFIFFVVKHIIA